MEMVVGIIIYFLIRCVLSGFYTVDQNERAVKTRFGRAQRFENHRTSTQLLSESLNEEERARYDFPVVHVIGPGLHFKMPWEKIYKTSIATETINMALDLENHTSNHNGTMLEAVTQDQLNIGLKGQIRYRVAEQNLYAYFFGIKRPVVHVMGYFVSVLREKIANYESRSKSLEPTKISLSDTHISDTVSINDLRKNLREINDSMLEECRTSPARYGIILEASADQTIVLSRRAVEIETLKVQAEVEPLIALGQQLKLLKKSGPDTLQNFVRNVNMNMFLKAKRIILEK